MLVCVICFNLIHLEYRFLSRQNFLHDMASPVIMLITEMATSLRPLNAQLYSPQEKRQLTNLVNIMLDLGLDLVPVQNHETGETEFQLEPWV